MLQLGVNIDHVASLRQARYRGSPATSTAAAITDPNFPDPGEPDPVVSAHEAELGGADIITMHLREDRRHVNDRDVELVRRLSRLRLNLEMAATEEMSTIALRLRVPMCTLVPEGRTEVTTEGGLNVAADLPRLTAYTRRLHDAGISVSAFIDPDKQQIDAARAAGFDACELHTGPYAAAFFRTGGLIADPRRKDRGGGASELDRLRAAVEHVRASGMRCNAGHALNYANVGPVAALMGIAELHIGHALVSRAIFIGLRAAVREMKQAITDAAVLSR